MSSQSVEMAFAQPTAGIGEVRIKPQQYHMEPGEQHLLTVGDGPGLGAVAWELDAQNLPAIWNGWQPDPQSTESTTVFRTEPRPGLEATMTYHLTRPELNGLAVTLSIINHTAHPQAIQPRLLGGQYLSDPLDHGRYQLLRASVGGKVRTWHTRLGGQPQRVAGSVAWVAAQTKYYTTIFESKTTSSALVVTYDAKGHPWAWLEWPAAELAPGAVQTWELRGYAGPLDYRYLDELQLDQAASLGAFTVISRLLRAAMHTIAGAVHSYGVAIVTLTVSLSALFAPLTLMSFRTMKKMQVLQPEIQQLQERHKKDPKKLNEELMKAYKKHQVNPMAGCLPLLFQMPVFIALYQVLSRSPELRGAKFLLIQDLSAPDAIIKLPSVLPVVGSAINVLPLAMAVMMFVQQRFSTQKAVTEEQRIQQQVFTFMPLLFGVMFYSLPSALVLYWLLNTTLAVVQQAMVARKFSA